MNMKKNKKKKIIIIAIIFILVLAIVGASYAYWAFSLNQVRNNRLLSSCLNVTLTSDSDTISLQKAYPILDADGMEQIPYTFTIKNTCDTFISYDISLGLLEETTLNSKYVAAVLDKNEIKLLSEYPEKTLDGYKEARVLHSGSLAFEDEVTFNLRIWMDESVTANDTDSMNKVLKSKIVVTANISTYSPVDLGFTTLADAMLVNEYQSTSLESAKERIAKKQTPTFSKPAPITEWQEVHDTNLSSVVSTMPHPDLVGQGGIYSNLTNENILPVLGTGYTFNSETGKYALTNYQAVDPTTLNYSQQDYYYCESNFGTDVNGNITLYRYSSNCALIYKVVGATKENGTTTGSNGVEIKTVNYRITAHKYNQLELVSDKSDKGLYIMDDDYGTSYYYRGSVTNNYVKFAGYYWRIIRLNGDGSVRMLYAGTSPTAAGTDLNMRLTDSNLGFTNRTTSPFNTTKNNPGYLGYMYGNTLNSSYAETNANENDSEIKKYLDSWYRQNIVDKGLSSYMADAGFCNDRSIASTANNGDGVQASGKNSTYAGYQRYYLLKSPKLVCPNASNDLFTLNGNSKGNQALTYPIGLITVDELMLSGLVSGYVNKLAYTYSSYTYWGMTPTSFIANNAAANLFTANSLGYANNYDVASWVGIRAVINLGSDVEITGGIGTANDPFVVKTA